MRISGIVGPASAPSSQEPLIWDKALSRAYSRVVQLAARWALNSEMMVRVHPWEPTVLNCMDKKSQQLGMNFGTACYRLERMLVLRLLKRLGEDFCFRCGSRIERVEDLSTEHKKDWQDIDPALFWDLDNIAFSHKRCNYSATKRRPSQGTKSKMRKAHLGKKFTPEHRANISLAQTRRWRTR